MDTTTTPNFDSVTMFSILKIIVNFLISCMVAAVTLLLVVGVGSLLLECWIPEKVSTIKPMEQSVIDSGQVPAGTAEREHPLAGIWAREELQVAGRKRREQRELEKWKHSEWEKGRADRLCRRGSRE